MEHSLAAARLAEMVDPDRLWSLLMALARIGGLANGGVAREALTDLDTEAKRFIIDWAKARSLGVFQDEAANLFVRLEGADSDAAPLMIGSHIDTQPTGGKFDGAYGVVAGLEVLACLQDSPFKPTRPIEVVAWTNEEGSRISPGATGSSAFALARQLADMAKATTTDGKSVGDEISRTIRATPAPMRKMAAARPFTYLEAHIEQGPVLEAEGFPVGIVTGIQGIRRLIMTFTGRSAHAGTTPHPMRSDALVAASRAMVAAHPLTEGDEALRLTFGRIELAPNSPNTVPAHVAVTVDLRHPQAAVLDEVSARLDRIAQDKRGPCEATVKTISTVSPVTFDPGLISLFHEAAQILNFASRPIQSGAGHDALHLARICPAGMIFIPCRDGVSHHETEHAEPSDVTAGARVLAFAAASLAGIGSNA